MKVSTMFIKMSMCTICDIFANQCNYLRTKERTSIPKVFNPKTNEVFNQGVYFFFFLAKGDITS